MNTKYIAEIAQSYEGKFDNLLNIIDSLGSTGVDFIMFQVIFADELANKQNNNYDFFKGLEFNDEQLEIAILKIKEVGKNAMGEVFGLKSAKTMVKFGVDALKIHPADVSNHPFLEEVASLDIPIYLGVGGCEEGEIKSAVDILSANPNIILTLMHGYQACPTSIEESHFSKIKSLKKFNYPVGYSDHSPGTIADDIKLVNPLAIYSPSIAVALGAEVIEKHVILDRSKKWEDYESALTPDELIISIDYMRSVENAMGSIGLQFNESEKGYRKSSKKYIVAKDKIEGGATINFNNITFKRIKNSSVGLINFSDVEGKTLKKTIMKDEPIVKENIS